MKIIKTIVLAAIVATSFNAAAGFGGTQDAGAGAITPVSKVGKMWDEAHVVVEGHLVEQTSGDRYTFRDESGSIQVELEHEDFAGLNVTANDKVRIYGEVDNGFRTSIEGYRIERVQ